MKMLRQDPDLAVKAEALAEGILPKDRYGYRTQYAWPYGPNVWYKDRLRLVEWAQPLGLRLSGVPACLGYLLRESSRGARPRCPASSKEFNYICRCMGKIHQLDHNTAWMLQSNPRRIEYIVSHPYGDEAYFSNPVDGLPDGIQAHGEYGGGWYGDGIFIFERSR